MITPAQQDLLNKYPSFSEFMKDYAPAELIMAYAQINTINRSVAKERISINDINEAYNDGDKEHGAIYLEEYLKFLNKISNVKNPLPETNTVAYLIFTGYGHFYLTDLKVILNKILKGDFGPFFYGSLEAQFVMSAFEKYDIERKAAERTVANMLRKKTNERYMAELHPVIVETKTKVLSQLKILHPGACLDELKVMAKLKYQKYEEPNILKMWNEIVSDEQNKIE